jgi:hypothetical protein
MQNRTCDGCTKCCEGYLLVEEIYIDPANPCKFVDKGIGCKSYTHRPAEVCRKFNCKYIEDPMIPEWLAPKHSNIIFLPKSNKPVFYNSKFIESIMKKCNRETEEDFDLLKKLLLLYDSVYCDMDHFSKVNGKWFFKIHNKV